MEDTFNDYPFKTLFDLDTSETVRRSSISERLSKIDSGYFHEIYQCVYQRFHDAYPERAGERCHLVHVDSSMVSGASGRLLDGIDNKSGKKAVKYSVAFDGLLPCRSKVYNTARCSSEDMALPKVVMEHVQRQPHHRNIYVIDRGLQSTGTMESFTKDSVAFIARTKEDRKHVELEAFHHEGQDLDLGEPILVKDSKVNLYTGRAISNKRGNIHHREELVETPFSLDCCKNKDSSCQRILVHHQRL